ncbi:hypothetical protein P3T76_014314 [Phytophthora citrophthora]|uniref:RxLR effector protein n=1 Tax=Phytophthora citrophthora TaxID=4793 RepID=A0AAD9LB76_9STRA|nr:hypothetical protein P3T76_014314 [Phytophthora citrophthora]
MDGILHFASPRTATILLSHLGLFALLTSLANAVICNSTELTEALQPVYSKPNSAVSESDVNVALPFPSPATAQQWPLQHVT